MYIPQWLLIFLGCSALASLFLIARLVRQKRCLRYCYLDMSDQYIERLMLYRELAIDMMHGDKGKVPTAILLGRMSWRIQIKNHAKMFRLAGMRPIDRDDLDYEE